MVGSFNCLAGLPFEVHIVTSLASIPDHFMNHGIMFESFLFGHPLVGFVSVCHDYSVVFVAVFVDEFEKCFLRLVLD